MQGYNATIFAYGQSVNNRQGSGKTFTMLGPEEVTTALVNDQKVTPRELQAKYGIIPRAIYQVFTHISESVKEFTEFSIKCSYIEIYNEAINDLLGNTQNLRIREFPKLGMCVIGMTEEFVTTPEGVLDTLSVGTKRRITSATEQNARSSRSHSIFSISVDQKLLNGSTKSSKLNLVDLAGSEKISKTHASGQQLKEAQNINLSLTTLGRCIKALAGGKGEHVPFRESKLTMILKESLGGNAKTTLLCTASQRTYHVEESLGTMKFAERAKKITLRATSNIRKSPEELSLVIDQLKSELSLLRQQIQDQSGCSLSMEAYTDLSIHFTELKSQYENLSETSEVEIERLRFREEQAAIQQSALLEQVEKAETCIAKLQQDNEQLRDQLQEEVCSERGRVEDLEQDSHRLNEALKEARIDLNEKEEEIGQLKEMCARLERNLNETHLKTTIYEQQLTFEQVENKRLADEKQELLTALSVAREEILRTNSLLIETEQQYNSCTAQLESAKAQLLVQDSQLQAFTEQLQTANRSISDLTASLSASESAKQIAENCSSALSTHLKLLESSPANEPSPVRSKVGKLSRAKAVIAKLMQELTDLKMGVDAARLQYQSELTELKQTNEERQLRLEQELKAAQNTAEEEKRTKNALLRTLDETNVELETAQFSLKHIKLQLLTSQTSLQEALSARESLANSFKQLKSELLTHKDSNLSALEKEASKARTQLLDIQRSCAATVGECQSKAQLLQEEKAALEEALLDREMELRDLDSLVKGLECQLSEEQERNRKLESSLEEATSPTKEQPTCRIRQRIVPRVSLGSKENWIDKGGFSLQDVQSLYSLDPEEGQEDNLDSLAECTLSEESEASDKAIHA